jgi:hypothetical protein
MRITILLCLLCTVMNVHAQDKLKVFFEKKIDTLTADTRQEITQIFKVIVPKQDKFDGSIVTFEIVKTDISPDKIYLPDEKTITLVDSKDTIKKEFTIKFQRSQKDDRLLTLKLTATDKAGKSLTLFDSATVYKVYAKPKAADTLKDASGSGQEFWLFTGTNLDLLDGVKAKELYFKGSYLFNLKQDARSTRSWIYLTFGKERFFADKDSASNGNFSDHLTRGPLGDSITIVRGMYNSSRNVTTDNIFTSLDYLYRIGELSSKESSLFLNAGFYIGLQTIKSTYSNTVVWADTSTSLRRPDSVYQFRPMYRDSKLKQLNYNFSFGFTHILSTAKLNVKSQLRTGVNMYSYPESFSRSGFSENVQYRTAPSVFTQLRLDATVLNPGIAIGFEAFVRQGQFPLFNVSLTKVLDFTQLSSLFGAVQSGTAK